MSHPTVFIGVLIGGSIAFIFSALAIRAVGRSAGTVVQEVRRQFREHPGIMDYTEKPEYGKVIAICTTAAQRELATPALLAVLSPVIVGFGINYFALGAFLVGAILTGQLMANFLSNSGGAWDNAKKYIEDGHEGGKGSEAHKAAVIGDTIGDPFKDTAGPALNPLIKVMNLVSLLILPAVITLRHHTGARLAIAGVALVVLLGWPSPSPSARPRPWTPSSRSRRPRPPRWTRPLRWRWTPRTTDGRSREPPGPAGAGTTPGLTAVDSAVHPVPTAMAPTDVTQPASETGSADGARGGRARPGNGAKPLVIVESPAKAKTIAGLLGSEYVVESSIGHIRDLPRRADEVPAAYKGEAWSRLGVDVDNGFKPLYVVSAEKKSQVAKLKQLVKQASEVYLASDEDREGESIAWHLLEVLAPRVPVKRMVFHEITRPAIERAVNEWRDLDRRLVDAQEARRILDRLYGYEVSPVLWKKIMPRLSAGRVQSVATRMVVERERSRMEFRPAGWWGIDATFTTSGPPTALLRSADGAPASFGASLSAVDGKPLASGRDFDAVGDAGLARARSSSSTRRGPARWPPVWRVPTSRCGRSPKSRSGARRRRRS